MEAAKAVGFTKPRMRNVCHRIIEIGRRRGVPREAMVNILFPRRLGKKSDDGNREEYSSNGVTIKSAVSLAQWNYTAAEVRDAQEEMEYYGLKELADRIKLGPPPRALYHPLFKNICADDYIFVYDNGFRVEREGSSWSGMRGVLSEIQGLVDLDEIYYLVNEYNGQSRDGSLEEICLVITLNEDLRDPNSDTVYHRGCELGFSIPPDCAREGIKFLSSIKNNISRRRRKALLKIRHNLISEKSSSLSGVVSYELVK